jgi:hypothetical protein
VIPLATTRISVLRVADDDAYAEPYTGGDTRRNTVQTGVRAVISRPTGREDTAGGEQAVWDFEMVCDTTDLRHTDTVLDEGTGVIYQIVWVMAYPDEHHEAGIRVVEGEV